jgi:hypothetical protein
VVQPDAKTDNLLESSGKRLTRPSDMRYFTNPAGSGAPLIKEFVLRTFGTANWTQFCPGNENGNPPRRAGCDFCRREIEFFCDENVLNGWFFDIYIQGSKKYNFKS